MDTNFFVQRIDVYIEFYVFYAERSLDCFFLEHSLLDWILRAWFLDFCWSKMLLFSKLGLFPKEDGFKINDYQVL